MLRDGRVLAEDFMSIISADWEQSLLSKLVTAENIIDFFRDYQQSKVRRPKQEKNLEFRAFGVVNRQLTELPE